MLCMVTSTRRWIYVAIGAAVGVGLVKALGVGRPKLEESSRVLLVGDSLAVGLAPHLRALAKEQRLPFDALSKEGTRIDQWAQSAALRQKLAQFQPTLVLVSLGTNDEYLMGDAVQRQKPYLEQLLQLVGSAELVWVGPPSLPKPRSNGIVALIRSLVPAEAYFPSETLQIPRGPDRLHPTARGYAAWAGALWQWLN
jgi:lysophospholipase L1-like esterase